MLSTQRITLIDCFIKYYSLDANNEDRKQFEWAADEFIDLFYESPEACWQLALEIIQCTDSEMVFANIGAGCLEDLLVSEPEKYLNKISEEINERKNIKLKKALHSTWQNDMSDEVWKKIQELVL